MVIEPCIRYCLRIGIKMESLDGVNQVALFTCKHLIDQKLGKILIML